MNAPTQLAHLQHVRDALRAVLEYTANGRGAFLESRTIQDAVVRNLEVVGEAVKGLDAETRARAPDVPWRLRYIVALLRLGENLQPNDILRVPRHPRTGANE